MDLGQDLVTNSHKVYQDNTSTIQQVMDGGGKPRSKCNKVRQGYVKKGFSANDITIKMLVGIQPSL
jgi:hypothetical protein